MSGSKRDLFLVGIICIALLTTTVPIPGMGEASAGTREPPPDFHNSYLNVNVTYENGTAANNIVVQFKNKNSFYTYSGTTNASGQVSFTIYGENWGIGTVKIREGVYWQGYLEFYIGPDEIVYLDMVLDEVPANVNKITGTVRNRTSGAVVPDLKMEVSGSDVYENYFTRSDYTDELGVFEIMVPNWTRLVRLEVRNPEDAGFFSYSQFLLMQEPMEVLVHDIDLLPMYMTGPRVRVRVYNSTTGEPMEGDRMNIRGYSSTYDHDKRSLGSMDWDGEFYAGDISEGEYRFEWYGVKDTEMNVTLNAEGIFLVNDTAKDVEMGIAVPGFADLDLEVWNSTDPLSSVQAQFTNYEYADGGRGSIYGYAYTGSDGKLHIGVPVGMETELKIYKSGYVEQHLTFAPTEWEAMERNITLEKKGPVVRPMGDVRIVVRDRSTGIPLPGAKLDGYGYYDDRSISIDYNTMTNGTGVYEGQIPRGNYYYINGNHNMGRGKLSDMTIGETNPDITIYIDRYDAYGEMEEYRFTLTDSSGNPLPDVALRMYPEANQPGSYTTYMVTDASGSARFFGYPNTSCRLYSDDDYISEYRQLWGVLSQRVYLPPEGGQLEDIVAYPAFPLSSIEGTIRDGRTMGVLPQAEVHALSFHLGEYDDFNPYISEYWNDAVYLYEHDIGSDSSGYYRAWGVDHVFLMARMEGYLPTLHRMDMDTRAEVPLDIVLDPVPESGFWVNGTVIDQYGEPVIDGYMTVTDDDRGGAPVPQYQNLEKGNGFSFYLWGGNFSLYFENMTLREFMPIHLTSDKNDVLFQVIPEFELGGTVTDREGTEVEGLNVSLILVDDGEIEVAWTLTDVDGHYVFEGLNLGDYRVRTKITELYDPYGSDLISASGWEDITLDIVLSNRTVADIMGTVRGEGGEYTDGIPDALVTLSQDGVEIEYAITDGDGIYCFKNVTHGTNFSLTATPPEVLEFVPDVRSGYLSNSTTNITVSGYEVLQDLYLPYQEEIPLGYLNITSVWPGPGGVDVPIDERIVIRFSVEVDPTTVDDLIEVTPALVNLTYSWDTGFTLLTLECDDLLPNTTYTVNFPSTALSSEGYGLHPDNVPTWNFTTGDTVAPWRLTDAGAVIISDQELRVYAVGKESLDVYFVIEGEGSYRLPEISDGSYELMVPFTDLAWKTTYGYHFSSTEDGPDEAPQFAGNFTTPADPNVPPGWEIKNATVTLDEDENWKIRVEGEEGMVIFIVIDGVGSFQLEEVEAGVYELTIDADKFDWNKIYSYHFSDSAGGPDLAPSSGGSVTTPLEPEVKKDDRFELKDLSILCCLSFVILLLVIILLVVIVRKKRRGHDLDEE